jgi:hypothetical protein
VRTKRRHDAERLLDDAHASHPEGVGVLVLVKGSSTRAPEGTRARLVGLIRRRGDQLKLFGAILEESGFAAAVARMVISAMDLVSQHKGVAQVFTSRTDAIARALERLEPNREVRAERARALLQAFEQAERKVLHPLHEGAEGHDSVRP